MRKASPAARTAARPTRANTKACQKLTEDFPERPRGGRFVGRPPWPGRRGAFTLWLSLLSSKGGGFRLVMLGPDFPYQGVVARAGAAYHQAMPGLCHGADYIAKRFAGPVRTSGAQPFAATPLPGEEDAAKNNLRLSMRHPLPLHHSLVCPDEFEAVADISTK